MDGDVSFLCRRASCLPVVALPAVAAAATATRPPFGGGRCGGGLGGGAGSGEADLNRQAVAQNLLVILHEVESRLQEEMVTVEGFSSKLREHAAQAAHATSPSSGGRRTVRSIWSDARALPGLDAADDDREASTTSTTSTWARPAASSSWVHRFVRAGASRASAGCGDWDESATRATHAKHDSGCSRPSWLAGGSSYKYFLGKSVRGELRGMRPFDRPLWLSPRAVPPGHPLGDPLGPCYEPALRPPLDTAVLSPLGSCSAPVRAPRSAVCCSRTRTRSDLAISNSPIASTARPLRRPTVTCPEYRRAQIGQHRALETSRRPDPCADDVEVQARSTTGDWCDLKEVYKNEEGLSRGMSSSEASSGTSSGTSPGVSEPSFLEAELPRGPASTPVAALSPDPTTAMSATQESDLKACLRQEQGSACSACRSACRSARHPPGGTVDNAWLVDAVHLLKEYYLKRAQLCLQTNIAASCHQLAVPETDVCRRDAAVGDDLVQAVTVERWVSTDPLLGRADAATSPRPASNPTRVSRTTQTAPVLCEPIHRSGEYQWVATDRLRPDLSLYVSCFSEAADTG